ncbi:TRADD-N-associated membrane domain-containing protein, partial [Vibrio parahaemolyticus]
ALLSAVSGLLVNFIGATFLVLYKSTMSQAKEYVAILERINAVGMSVQVLEKIEDSNKTLKDQTISDLSKQLLTMYSEVK